MWPFSKKETTPMADNAELAKPDPNSELIALKQTEFDKMVSPKKLSEAQAAFFFVCPSKSVDPFGVKPCGNRHFRHAGYFEAMMPLIQADGQKRVCKTSEQVHICTVCKSAYIWYDSQMYDVTDLIDVKAWEKTEREAQLATGPGGQC